MANPFTNTHLHVFNGTCAPDRFLMIIPMNFLRKHPITVKRMLESKVGRFLIDKFYKSTLGKQSAERKKLDKYLSFLDVANQATQQQVFEMALQVGKQYDSKVRLVGLTLDMDYMDSQSSKFQKSYSTQLEEVKAVKRFYPANFFPFLGVDPRARGGDDLLNWAKQYFENGVVAPDGKIYPYFAGIKLYPALGFFPFDPRLEKLYAYAEANNIPVMTHCTRSGSQYVGNQIETLIPKAPTTLPIIKAGTKAAQDAEANIVARIARYYNAPDSNKPWIQNSDLGENDLACDLFGHPENYVPLFEKFPNLKICLAHMGGSDEIYPPKDDKQRKQLELIQSPLADGKNWFDEIVKMMQRYANMYTDISYTLSDLGDSNKLNRIKTLLQTKDEQSAELAARVLFGTDFFMTEQETTESELYTLAKTNLSPWFDQIARVNTQTFLMQPI